MCFVFLSFYYFFVLSIFISIKPIAVHISSLILTISATKMPLLAAMASPDAESMNPPSRPPSCNGMKKRRLAKSDVNASIMTHDG